MQARPHAPQLFGSVTVLVHVPLHSCSPRLVHAQAPLTQVPLPQSTPQPPQFWGLVLVLVQRPPQVWYPVGQPALQMPPTQFSVLPQVVPQPPQFLGSLSVTMHRPLHSELPGAQVHEPLVHV